MPFVNANDVRELIEEGLHSVIDTPGLFDLLEKNAADQITDITGVVAPDDASDAPAWVKLPAAFIVEWLASSRLSSSSEELHNRIKGRYNTALEILERHRKKNIPPTEEPIKFANYIPLKKGWS